MPASAHAAVRRMDVAAVDATLRRLAALAEPAWLHAEVARRMAERLPLIRLQPERIVDWWSFLGASKAVLRNAYPKAERVRVEPHPALVERSLASERPAWWSPRRLLGEQRTHVQEETKPVEPAAQLVWANMMLHAVCDPPALMERWHHALSADGFVMFSCFGPDTVKELRGLYKRLGWPAPTVDFVDMHDLGDMLMHAGFADPVMDQETLNLSWPDPDALLAELRTLGGNASPDRFAGLRTPRWRDSLREALRGLDAGDGRLGLRFEIVYGHAFKALPRALAGEPTTVSLDDMRTLVRARRPHG